MFSVKLLLSAAAAAIALAVTIPAQGAATFLEDFEALSCGSGDCGTLGDNLGWDGPGGGVGFGPGANLGTNVANKPGSNRITRKAIGGGAVDDLMTFKADLYTTGIYDTAGGEALVGVGTSSGYGNSFLAGPGANPTNPGYPGAGGGGWFINDGLNDTGRINITDGGAPGMGNRFFGGTNVATTLQMAFNQQADTISVDILDRATQTSLNPTFVVPLTAGGKAELAAVSHVVLSWMDVHPGDLKEVDNVSFVSSRIITPTTMWANDTPGDWNTFSNWSTFSSPNGNTSVVGLGEVITAPRTVTNNGAVIVNGIIFGDENASSAQQPYTIDGSGSVTLAGNLNDSPVILVRDGSHQFQDVGVNFSDSAEVSIGGGSSLAFNNVVNLNGNTLSKISNGTVSINDTVNTGAGGSVAVAEGVVNGTGTVIGQLTNAGGAVAPGLSPGKLSVVGDYLQTAGSLQIEIDGTTAESQHDVLDVTGDLTISGGAIDVALGYVPASGDSFDILNFASGDLSAATLNLAALPVDLAWDRSQLEATGTLSVVPILPTMQWVPDAAGDWNSPTNWTPLIGEGTLPNSNVEVAVFGDAITAPRTVFTDTGVTVKGITFDNANDHIIAGAGAVTLESDTGTSTVKVLQGSPQFQAVVNLANATDVEVADGATLSFNNVLNLDGNTITKNGPGAVLVNNNLNTGGGTILAVAGEVSGSGTVAGDLVNQSATVAPGNSPGVLTIDGDYTQQLAGTLALEIAGLTAGEEYDRLVVNGDATIDGTVVIELIDGFIPQANDNFDVLDFNSFSGTPIFDFSLSQLAGGLAWDTSQFSTDGRLCVSSCGAGGGVAGDFNNNGVVDAADYTTWRDAVGSNNGLPNDNGLSTPVGTAHYDLWKANFGNTGSGSAAVPEPATLTLVLLAALTGIVRTRCR
jgi:hypothetical protein